MSKIDNNNDKNDKNNKININNNKIINNNNNKTRYLLDHMDWLKDIVEEGDDDYILFDCPGIYLCIYLSTYPSIYQSIYLSGYLSINQPTTPQSTSIK